MGKPPGHDDEPHREADPDRAAILARRQRFIALALSGLATTACEKPTAEPSTPKSGEAVHEGRDAAGEQADEGGEKPTPPEPETPEVEPEPENDDDGIAPPQACLKIAAPPPEPKPQPCLSVRPDPRPDPRPTPCLKVAPRPKDEPDKPKPQPCLRVRPPSG